MASASRRRKRRPRSFLSCSRLDRLDAGDRLGKVARGEGLEVLDAFAHADEMHWQSEFLRDGDQYPSSRRAVELRHHETAHSGRPAEDFHLIEGVLTHGRIENQ